MNPESIQKIDAIAQAARIRWGNSSPFQIVTRLTEELGEIAAEVNHLENQGIKREKRPDIDPKDLAKEIYDLLRGVSELVSAYGLESVLDSQVQESYSKWVEGGYIDDHEPNRPAVGNGDDATQPR